MEKKFTPGPWKWTYSGTNLGEPSQEIHSAWIYSGNDDRNQFLLADFFEFDREVQANLQLASSAPDLYDALEEVGEFLNTFLEDTDGMTGEDGRIPNPLTAQCRAALAKARGEM